jgi:microcystin-dependent protein
MTWNTKGDMTSPVGAPGEVKMWAGATAPTGWLLCDGSEVSRTVYATLFAIVGTAFGTGNASTTFNLPDMRSRFPVGVGLFAGRGQNEAGVPGSILGTPPAESVARQDRMGHTHTHTTGGTGQLTRTASPAGSLARLSRRARRRASRRRTRRTAVTRTAATRRRTGSGHTHNVSSDSGIASGTVHAFTSLNFIVKT